MDLQSERYCPSAVSAAVSGLLEETPASLPGVEAVDRRINAPVDSQGWMTFDQLKCLFTSLVISNMETCFLPPKTLFRRSSALMLRRFLLS